MNFIPHVDRQAASYGAAEFLAAGLKARLAGETSATLIVSGGSTPGECFAALSAMPLDWGRVSVMPTDERRVPAEHEASNERMIRQQLLQNLAQEATYISLLDSKLAVQDLSVTCALVGMGEDGHFASIFPDCANLQPLLDMNAAPQCVQVETAASEHGRVSANLSLLLSGDSVALLIFGEHKKKILFNPDGLPIASLLQQKQTPVQVYWAP
ncbi:MAG: 6-phosphogluconolactonase [Pseudomonadales bacterium]